MTQLEQEALAHVRAILLAHGADRRDVPGQRFRSRVDHIKRVYMWVKRLAAQDGGEVSAALGFAAVFHDVGYALGDEDHARHSEAIFRAYAAEKSLDAQMAERAAFLVREHSAKGKWLGREDAPRDLILLMEGDLLDEEGAMGLVRDCLNAGEQGGGFDAAYQVMRTYEPKRLEANSMVTPLGRALWAKKQGMIRAFMKAYAYDLGMDGEEGEWP